VLLPPLHEVWQALIPGSLENPVMLMSLAGNKLSVSSVGGSTLLDAQSGKVLAKPAKDIDHTITRQYATLSADGKYFYYIEKTGANADQHTLVALDNATNTVRWTYAVGAGASLTLEPGHGDIVLVYSEVGDPPTNSIAERLDSSTGKVLWKSQHLQVSSMGYQVLVTLHHVYVQTVAASVTKLDASSGAFLGSRAVAGRVLVDAEGMYVVGSSNVSYIKDWAVNQPAYSFSYPQAGYYVDAALADDGLYIVVDSTQQRPDHYQYSVYKLGLDGKQAWAASFNGYQVNGVAGSNGLLFLQVQKNNRNRLLALNSENGKVVWQSANLGLPNSSTGANLFGESQIVIGGGKLYMIYSQDYRSTEVHAFETAR